MGAAPGPRPEWRGSDHGLEHRTLEATRMVGRVVLKPDPTPSRSATLAALQVGLAALLIYACARIALPFTNVLLWSVILAVMLHPVHVRLSGRIGNRWSAILIGLICVAAVLAPTIIVAASLATSISSLGSAMQPPTL